MTLPGKSGSGRLNAYLNTISTLSERTPAPCTETQPTGTISGLGVGEPPGRSRWPQACNASRCPAGPAAPRAAPCQRLLQPGVPGTLGKDTREGHVSAPTSSRRRPRLATGRIRNKPRSRCLRQKLAGGLWVASPLPPGCTGGPAEPGRMRSSCVLLAALVALAAYYVYIPLPGAVSDPWKLMLLDATFRGAQQVSNLIHYLGLSHHLIALNFIIIAFGKKSAWSSAHVQVTDTDFDGVEVRVFEGSPKPGESLKRSVVYIHGGGWALASAKIRYYDELCAAMAEELNAVIVSIEYRLVPQVYFPEQIHDIARATKYFLQPEVLQKYKVDPSRIGISGDSAGGNLAAALGQQFIQDASLQHKLKLQALIYPVLQALDFNTPSYQQNVNTPILPRYVMVKYWVDYFKGNYDFVQAMIVNNHTSLDVKEAAALRARVNWTSLLPAAITKHYKPVVPATGDARIIQEIPELLDARSSPLLADQEVLRLLPKTYILTCEHDVLRDDGLMYAKRLESAGVDVTLDHFEDGFHGCMIFTSWPTNFSVGIRTRNSFIRWLDQNL